MIGGLINLKFNGRFEELDSLRGLAATTVVIHHLSLVVPSVFLNETLKDTLFHIFWAGHEAVIMFFVLSGFVLSLPYLNNTSPSYKDYLIKRYCRIYIPYTVSILFAVILMGIFSRGGISELGKWFNNTWITPFSSDLFFKHIFLLGRFDGDTVTFNPVIWSLVHEMRISFIFPIIVYLISKNGWKRNLILPIMIPVLLSIIYFSTLKIFKFDITLDMYDGTSYLYSLHYISFFMLGTTLAKYRQTIYVFYSKLGYLWKISLLLSGLLAYTYSFNKVIKFHHFVIDDWAIAIGSLIFIVFSINSKTIKKILLLKSINFIGKISYSLYLFHMIVIFAMVNVFYGSVPISIILPVSFIISFCIATLMYFIIEKPSIKLGKFLTQPKNKLIQKGTPRRVV